MEWNSKNCAEVQHSKNIQSTEGCKCVSENLQNKSMLSLSQQFSHNVQPKLGR